MVSTAEFKDCEIDFEEDIDNDLVEFYTSSFVPDVKMLVKGHLIDFFDGREMHCGGNIPQCLLCSEQNISMVLNTRLEKGIHRAYKGIALDGNISTEAASDSLVPEDIKMVVSVMNAAAKRKIPPQYIPGIVLLYLEYCEGIEFAF
jgi:hypothetical protein